MNSKKILLIDDNEKDADFIRSLLKEKGYRVSYAFNGKDGLKKARHEKYDLIILDLLLPDIKGEEICASLKRLMRYRKIPIIVLSVKDEIEDIESLFELGADDYIIKPPRPQHLLDKIEEYI